MKASELEAEEGQHAHRDTLFAILDLFFELGVEQARRELLGSEVGQKAAQALRESVNALEQKDQQAARDSLGAALTLLKKISASYTTPSSEKASLIAETPESLLWPAEMLPVQTGQLIAPILNAISAAYRFSPKTGNKVQTIEQSLEQVLLVATQYGRNAVVEYLLSDRGGNRIPQLEFFHTVMETELAPTVLERTKGPISGFLKIFE